MDRFSAVRKINSVSSEASRILNRTTHFASINASKKVWWFDLPLKKIYKSGHVMLHLLLFDQHNDKLHQLDVPVAFFQKHIEEFAFRSDNTYISIELSAESPRLFKDVRSGGNGLSFITFLVRTLHNING